MLELWRKGALEERMSQIKRQISIEPAFGKREQGVLKEPGGCLKNQLQGLQLIDTVINNCAIDERMAVLPDQKSRPHGLYVIGFIGQCKLAWLVDTGAMRNVLSYKCYMKLPESLRFPLHEDGSQVFVADGRKTSTYGTGKLSVRIGRQDVTIRVVVADIEDSAILGMDFLADVDATTTTYH